MMICHIRMVSVIILSRANKRMISIYNCQMTDEWCKRDSRCNFVLYVLITINTHTNCALPLKATGFLKIPGPLPLTLIFSTTFDHLPGSNIKQYGGCFKANCYPLTCTTSFKIQQDRQYKYNKMLKRVRETTVAEHEAIKNNIFLSVRVRVRVCERMGSRARGHVLSRAWPFLASTQTVLYCHLWPLCLHNIFSTLTRKAWLSGKSFWT
jgi:hypothetical protein